MRGTHYQGGSIFSFVVVVVLAAALLIGGAVWLRHRSDAARQATVDIAMDGASTDEKDEKTSDSEKSTKKTDSDKKKDSDKSSTSTSTASSSASESAADSSELPRSGPKENIAALIGLAATTYAVVRYSQSRRSFQTL